MYNLYSMILTTKFQRWLSLEVLSYIASFFCPRGIALAQVVDPGYFFGRCVWWVGVY